MTRILLPLSLLTLVVAAALVAHKASEQDAQLNRIEALCAERPATPECIERAAAEPMARNAVRRALCEAGYDRGRFGNVTVNAASACQRKVRNPHGVRDVLLGQDSLATQGVCDALAAEAACPDNNACRNASNARQFLCRCPGSGYSRAPDGTLTMEGLFRGFRVLDPSACPASSHKGCALLLEMTNAQWHVLRLIAHDDDFPAAVKVVIDAMRADPRRASRRSDVPACLRSRVPVRAGRGDIDGAVDFDGGVP